MHYLQVTGNHVGWSFQPRRDSNPQSSDPKSDALSIRPRGLISMLYPSKLHKKQNKSRAKNKGVVLDAETGVVAFKLGVIGWLIALSGEHWLLM